MLSKKTYEGSRVSIYTSEGEQICRSTIKWHDTNRQHIAIDATPENVEVGELCAVLVRSKGSLKKYSSRVAKDGAGLVFMLFKGEDKEDRKSVRYALKTTACIEQLFLEGEFYELLSPVPVQVVNMSQGGVRIRAPKNSLLISDRFYMKIKLGEEIRPFEAIVMNTSVEDGESEYGCQFIWKLAVVTGEGDLLER